MARDTADLSQLEREFELEMPSGNGAAEMACGKKGVASFGTFAENDLALLHGADERDGEEDAFRIGGCFTAGNGHVVTRGQFI